MVKITDLLISVHGGITYDDSVCNTSMIYLILYVKLDEDSLVMNRIIYLLIYKRKHRHVAQNMNATIYKRMDVITGH